MKKVLITGAAGFVGTHLVEEILKKTNWEIVTLDRFDAAGNPNRLSDMLENTPGIDRSRVRFVFWDLKAEFNEGVIQKLDGPFDYIIHLAAGSHVDRSIDYPLEFFMDNTIGTVNLLNYAKNGGLNMETGKFLYFSTDEVYGPAPTEVRNADGEFEAFKGFKEWDRHNPNNPYAAAKSAAEMACISYANTYRMPIAITNCMNIFGERQDREKFIPILIKKALEGGHVSIHANKDKTKAGQRHYLHARNICSAVVWVLENGKVLDGSATQGKYNVVGEKEVDNLELAQLVGDIVKELRPEAKGFTTELVDFHSSRPGHDLRYALDGEHMASEGFSYPVAFEESLHKVVEWTLNHPEWL